MSKIAVSAKVSLSKGSHKKSFNDFFADSLSSLVVPTQKGRLQFHSFLVNQGVMNTINSEHTVALYFEEDVLGQKLTKSYQK